MEKRNNGLVLGLDIGVTSVGYGIVNRETGEAVDFGVRLFSEWDPANNQNRRAKRSGRRLRSRRKNRLQDMKKIKSNKYNKKFGFGDLIAYMMPHAIIILITSIIFFGVWLMFNLPIGFNTVNFF